MALLLAFMTLLTFYQVVLRYVFNSGLLWAQEAVLYSFAWLVLLGLAYGIRTRAHLGIDLVVKSMRATSRRLIGLVAVALSMLYAGLLAYGSYVYIAKLYDVGIEAQDLPIERWMLGAIMPLGFGLLFVRLCVEAWLILSGQAAGFDIADEAADVLKDNQIAADASVQGEAHR